MIVCQVRELQRRLGERERQHEATAQAKDSDLRAANANLHEAKVGGVLENARAALTHSRTHSLAELSLAHSMASL